MQVRKIGEREVIKRVVKHFSQSGDVEIGDDCATVDIGTQFLLVTTDMINEKSHIPDGATGFQVGWFITAINLSDIAAKGGQPLGITLALGIPRSLQLEFLEEMAKGANTCAENYGMTVIGGDTKEADTATFTGTAIGVVEKTRFMPRRGAENGNSICLIGSVGGAAAGLYALEKKIGDRNLALDKVLRVIPRVKEGQVLASTGGVTSCMDISDGLASSLYQLQDVNDVGFRVYWEKLPVSSFAKTIVKGDRDLTKNLVLYQGGDYGLLCTVKKDRVSMIKKSIMSINGTVSVIGAVTGEKEIIIHRGGSTRVLENLGFEHFLQPRVNRKENRGSI